MKLKEDEVEFTDYLNSNIRRFE